MRFEPLTLVLGAAVVMSSPVPQDEAPSNEAEIIQTVVDDIIYDTAPARTQQPSWSVSEDVMQDLKTKTKKTKTKTKSSIFISTSTYTTVPTPPPHPTPADPRGYDNAVDELKTKTKTKTKTKKVTVTKTESPTYKSSLYSTKTFTQIPTGIPPPI